jgi:hypothetical protein
MAKIPGGFQVKIEVDTEEAVKKIKELKSGLREVKFLFIKPYILLAIVSAVYLATLGLLIIFR